MRRFYVPPSVLVADRVELDPALSHRLARVLRLRAAEEVALFDGSGTEARARLEDVADRRVSATIIERYDAPAEPHVKVHLYQSITKGERFDWLLEKGTEVGVARFVPIVAARAVVKTGEGNRLDRWRRIAVEAAEQCGRGAVPSVEAPAVFLVALAAAPGVVLFSHEDAPVDAPNIDAVLRQEIDAVFALGEVSIFVGPEGGWEPSEVAASVAAGAHVVTLGDRVLRSETAGIVAATLALHALGELG
ncbi:MAG: 16S rRNA (uracil(1498)-N(3))-methyltransferase [Chloroflexota bacterium]|nr:16S rRNA (uracil(1498)-N(3))-methyltransferase [Chloroflexota bacterium]